MRYSVIRYWEVRDEVEVEAGDPSEAIDLAHCLPLSRDAGVVPDSMNSDEDTDVQEIDS